MRLSLLVVDDQAEALFLLDHQLRHLGCTTVTAASAAEARGCLAAQPFDLIVCAIDLSGESGLDLLRWVRARGLACPVILTTARPAVSTAIQALREGAVDYLTKPVSLEELRPALERVAQRLGRAPVRASALPATAELPGTAVPPQLPETAELRPLPATADLPPPPSAQQYQIGPVLLDLDRFLVAVNGRRIDATPSELEILHYLCRHPDRVVTAQELVRALRGYQVDSREAPEIIRPHISNLRRKLLAAAVEADVVRTVRGVGYMLRR